jgi:hypothetical protein
VIADKGRSVVRHYLQDVGSTFGTGALGPHEYDEGWEYLLDLGLMRKRFFLFGFPIQPWQTVDYADNEAIGRFEGTEFDPPEWRPRVPFASFLHARLDDSFWAARRVAAFSDEMIRASAKTGQYSTATDESLLADVLIQRRNKISQYYFNAINPLVDFALSPQGRITFRNAAVDAGVAKAPGEGYRATWATFDNNTGDVTLIGSQTVGTTTEIAAPPSLPTADGAFIRVGIVTLGQVPEPWTQPVEVYFRRTGSGWKLVGVDRLK